MSVIKGDFKGFLGKEKTRTNTGRRGARKTRLTHQEKILMGKGAVKTIREPNCTPWMGATGVSQPFDPVQAEKNWAEGLCG